MKKLFLFAATAAMLAGCSDTEELALNQAQQEVGQGEVSFSVYTNRSTRGGVAGEMTTDALKAEGAGFGVFAYHTNNSFYDSQNSEINFMYNQKVTWEGDETGEGGQWVYSPLKYWPNEFGENAKSNNIDYVTFFAYAPFVNFYPSTGVAPVAEGQDANQQQWKNITAASRNGDTGDPVIRYMVDTNPSTSVDLLWGVAADEKFVGMADATKPTQLKTNGCFIDLSKQKGVNDKINWKFYHALAKLNVQIIAANDVVTQDVDPYTPKDKPVHNATRVYLRWIEFTGFTMNGALNLHSNPAADEASTPRARWMAYDGATDLKPATVRFNDGLMDGKEGTENNMNPNERVLGALNPVLVEPTTPAAGWTAKEGGIPTNKYINLFDGAGEDNEDEEYVAADASIYVIPTGESMTINMLYDIQTADARLGNYLSDGKTKGFRVANAITNTLQDLKIEAGKAYTIKIVVGLESVKVDATVKGWDDSEEAVANMPENPEPGAVTAAQAASLAKDYVYDPAYTYAGTISINNSTNEVNYTITEEKATEQRPGDEYPGFNIMNDMARFLGALFRAEGSGITEITYKDVTYSWDKDKGLKGSNWVDQTGTTLVSVLTADFLAHTITNSVTLGTNKGNLTFNITITE